MQNTSLENSELCRHRGAECASQGCRTFVYRRRRPEQTALYQVVLRIPLRVIDGVFEPVEEADDGPQAVRFRAAAEAVAAITDQVRIRVLRWFARNGLIERDDVREMRALRAPPSPAAGSRSTPRCTSARTRCG